MPRSRSLTRLTMRVGLEHFGQSVLLVVSIIFLRSAVLATLAMGVAPRDLNGALGCGGANRYLRASREFAWTVQGKSKSHVENQIGERIRQRTQGRVCRYFTRRDGAHTVRNKGRRGNGRE